MGQNPYLSLLRTAWRYARAERGRYLLVYALFVVSNLIAMLHAPLYGWLIDRVQRAPAQVLRSTAMFAAAFLGLKFGEWCFHGPARVLERKLAFNLSRNFLNDRYHQALHLPMKWHQDHHSGATINRIRKAYEALRSFFDSGFMYLHAIAKFVFSFAAILYFSPLFGLVAVILGALIVWVIFQFDGPFIKTQEEVNEREHVVSATLFDSLSNILTVITLRLEKSMETGLMAKVHAVLAPFVRNVRINEWKWFTADMLVSLTYVVIASGFVYQHWVPGQVFYVGSLVTLLSFVNQFTSVFHDVAWQYTQIVQYNTDVRTADSIEQAYLTAHRADETSNLPAGWRQLHVSNIQFSHNQRYEGTRRAQSLHDLAITLERGKRIALVGESGSGKSTLLALLRGLYEPEPGVRVTADGAEYTLASVNETTTLFPQEPEIFENTIRYNITLGLPFEEAEIDAVVDAAHFRGVAAHLPNGLESGIQEKGVNLSGGQKQRLALARGILAARESDIVLLDEPTSSVDPKTEQEIYQGLFRLFRGKAVVSALHRLHLLRWFDYVYVLKEGRIVDEGTFEDLRARSVVFGDLWRHQEQSRAESG